MMSNPALLNHLLSKPPAYTFQFSRQVYITDTDLRGAGGQAGEGFVVPCDGYVYKLIIWDGSLVRTGSEPIPVKEGDRIDLQAVYTEAFTVTVYVNGSASDLAASPVNGNTSLYATVYFAID